MKQSKPEEWLLDTQYDRDLHSGRFVEAICAHGMGHHNGTHGCDGCCSDMPEEFKEQVTKD